MPVHSLLEPTTDADLAALAPDFSRGVRRAPLITVAIPAYNRPHLLSEALASLACQRGFDDFEVVVCDDGGLAETQRVVEDSALLGVRFYRNASPLGAVENWNRCLRLARGQWVTLLHEDDLLYPWFFASVGPRLRSDVAAVAVRCAQAAKPPAFAAPRWPTRLRTYAPASFLKSSMTPFPGVVFSRSVALRVGGFDARLGGIADYAFWYELARAGRIEVLRDRAAFYRLNQGQWTEREWPAMLRRAHLLRLRIAREQLGRWPRLGRWFARFYTARMAAAYAQRFPERPAILARARRFARVPFGWASSGWVWKLLQLAPRFTRETPRSSLPRPRSPQTVRP